MSKNNQELGAVASLLNVPFAVMKYVANNPMKSLVCYLSLFGVPAVEAKRDFLEKALDDVSGSKTRNERIWAGAFFVGAEFVTGGSAKGLAGAVASGVGSTVGAAAHAAEKSLHHAVREGEKTVGRWFGC